MSTVIFASNQIISRRTNQINNFKIKLSPPIDARSGKNSIIVEEILHPNTISTIHPRNKEEFQMNIQMKIAKFMLKKDKTLVDSEVIFVHEVVQVPYGHHTLSDLIIFFNKTLHLFNMSLACVMGNKCVLNFVKIMSYYSTTPSSFDGFDNNKYMKKSDSRESDCDKYKIEVPVTFSKGLTHVLGYENSKIEFKTNVSTNESKDFEESNRLYVMDPSYGLNFLNITCDKILPVQMGFVYKENLLVCPLQLPNETSNTKRQYDFICSKK